MSSDDESKPPAPSDLSRVTDELAAVKVATGRVADAMLKIHSATGAVARMVDRVEKSIDRVERKVGDHGERLAILIKEADDTQDKVDELKEDISQPIPLQPAHDPQLDVGPVSMPRSVWRRASPYMIGGLVVLCFVGLLALLGVVYVSTHAAH